MRLISDRLGSLAITAFRVAEAAFHGSDVERSKIVSTDRVSMDRRGRRVQRHLALASAAAAAMSAAANAAIVYSGVVNINIPSTNDGVYLNVMTGVTGSTGGSVAGWDVNPYSPFGAAGLNWNPPDTSQGYAGDGSGGEIYNLSAGTLIDSGLSYSIGYSDTTGANAVS